MVSNKYEKLILMGDFNMTTSNPVLSQFLDTFALSPLNIDSAYFKNSKIPSCIDLLLTNFKPSFMKTNVKLVSLTIIKQLHCHETSFYKGNS